MAAAEYYLRIMEAQAAEGDAAGARDYAGLALRHAQEGYEGARPDAAIEREAPATKAGALAFFEEQRERYRAVEREGAAEVAPRLFARAGADLSRGEHELRQTGHGKEGVGALLRAAAVLDQVEALDADEDGVLDLADAAPDEPEDVDGYEDGDGAPDPDNDRDGIPDTIDRAPLEPETVNGWMDMDGAPDSLPQLAPVTFARGSASVGREARGYLRGLSALLAASDALGLSIAARADPGLAPAEALALARRRGQAVRDALVEAGMDPARLETTFSAEGPADGFGQVQLAIE
jgi:outer membrane protein OmpA-like peptidoglycan-associated protein